MTPKEGEKESPRRPSYLDIILRGGRGQNLLLYFFSSVDLRKHKQKLRDVVVQLVRIGGRDLKERLFE